jgi:hypothetical protein
MEAIFSSETSVEFQRTTLCYIPEYSTVQNHRCENLKSYINLFYLAIFNSFFHKQPTESLMKVFKEMRSY